MKFLKLVKLLLSTKDSNTESNKEEKFIHLFRLDDRNFKNHVYFGSVILLLGINTQVAAASWPTPPASGPNTGGECVLTHHQNIGVNADPNSFYKISDHRNPATLTAIGPWNVSSGTVEGLTADVSNEIFYGLNADRAGKLILGTVDPVSGNFSDITTTGSSNINHSVYGSLSIFQARGIAHRPGTNELWVVAYFTHPANDPGSTYAYLFKMSTVTGEVITGAFGGEDYIAIDLAPYTFNKSNDRPSIEALTFHKDQPNVLYGVLSTLNGGNPKVGHLFAVDVSQAVPEAVLAPKNLSGVSYTSGNATPASTYYDIEGMSFDKNGNLIIVSSNVGGTNANSILNVDPATGTASNKRTIISGDWEGIVCDPDFPNLYTISGNVSIDLNNDGNSDITPLNPVTMTLKDSSGSVVTITTTDAAGNYSFDNIVEGIYTVEETDPSNTTSVSDTDGNNDNTISVDISVANSTNNNFIDKPQTGGLSGTIYNDDNQDVLYNNSEQPIANIDIVVTDDYGQKHNVTSDTNGNYSIADLPAGSIHIAVKSDDPDLPEGVTNTGSTDDTTINVVAGSSTIHNIGFYMPVADINIDPASVASCANPTSITWQGATVSSGSVWTDLNAPTNITTVGGDPVTATFTLTDNEGQFNFDDGGLTSAHAGTNDGTASASSSAFPQPYLSLYLGKQNTNVGTSLSSGDSATLTVDFSDPVILDNWRVGDIDSGDQRGGEGSWPWQDAVQVLGVDANNAAVPLTVALAGASNLIEDSSGFVHTDAANFPAELVGSGTGSTSPVGHAVWSSNGMAIKKLVLNYKAGPDLAGQTRAAIAVSGLAVCKSLIISGSIYNDGNGDTDSTVNGSPIGLLDTNDSGVITNVPLYAHLVSSSGSVVDVGEVDNVTGMYTFSELITPNTNYTVQLSTAKTNASQSMPVTELPSEWNFASEDVTTDSLINGVIPVAVTNSSLSLINFGLNKSPTNADVAAPTVVNPGSNTQVPFLNQPVTPQLLQFFGITDKEDTVPATLVIDILPANGILYYDNVAVTAGQVIPNIDYDKILFDPVAGYVTISFVYHYLDSAGVASPQGTISKTFTVVDPTAADDNASNPNIASPTNPTIINVISNDTAGTYAFDPTTVELIDPVTGAYAKSLFVADEGVWTVNASGDVTFTPAVGFTQDPTPIDYLLKDTEGNEVTATIRIDYPQTAPTAVNDAVTGISGQATTLTPVTNNGNGVDNDPENDIDITTVVLTSSSVLGATISADGKTITVPNEGVWTVDGTGAVTFTPDAGFTADPTPVGYKISDTTGLQSNEATITIDYAQAPPTAVDDSVNGVSTTPTIVDVIANDTDPENDLDPSSVKLLDSSNTPVSSLTVIGEGVWTVDAVTGKVTFTPEAGFTGDPTPVKYTVKDNNGLESNQATVTIDYPQNPPVAVNDYVALPNQSDTAVIASLANDSDPENDLDISKVNFDPTSVGGVGIDTDNDGDIDQVTVVGEGIWNVDNTGTVTFVPDGVLIGDPTPIDYVISDSTGQVSNKAEVYADYPPYIPVAKNDSVINPNTASPTNPTTIDMIGNDGDLDGDLDVLTLNFDAASVPGGIGSDTDSDGDIDRVLVSGEGIWTVDNTGSGVFTPEAGFTGDPTPIKYTVKDTGGRVSSPATVSVDYPQTAPVAMDDQEAGLLAQPTTITPVDDNGNGKDSDPEDDLDPSTLVLTSSTVIEATIAADGKSIIVPNEGTWIVAANGDVTFTPLTGYTGDPTPVGYKVSDNTGLQSNEAKIILGYPQTAPTAKDDHVSGLSGQATTLTPVNDNGSGADIDPQNDLDASTLILTSSPVVGSSISANGKTLIVPSEGIWTVDAAGDVTFTPIAGFTGDPTLVGYKVSDKTGLQSGEANITIDYPQSAPISSDDSKIGVTATPVEIDVLANDTDLENDLDPKSVKLVDPNNIGTPVTTLTVLGEGVWVVDTVTGKVTFTPETGFTADPTPVTYTVKDIGGVESNQSVITVDYPQSNPVAEDDIKSNQKLGTAVTLKVVENDTDPDNDLDPTTVKLLDSSGNPVTTLIVPNEGEWKVDVITGDITFTPESGFTSDPTPVEYSVKDLSGLESNNATVTIDYEAAATITGTVWLDRNKDGVIDSTEDRKADWIIKVLDKNDNLVATSTTDTNGVYSVTGLIPDEYSVEFYMPNGVHIATSSTNGAISAGQKVDLPLPIDPSGVVYDSVTRQPLSNVKIQLVNSSGTPVADACLGAGQQNQITLADGLYKFDVLPSSDPSCPDGDTYSLKVVTAPAGYFTDSTIIPAQTDVYDGNSNEANCTLDSIPNSGSCEVQTQPDAPKANEDTTYFMDFLLNAGDDNIIFNHIPLDSQLSRHIGIDDNAIVLTKSVSKKQASVGDQLYYTIVAENTTSNYLEIDISDDLPLGFMFTAGKAKLVKSGTDGVFDQADYTAYTDVMATGKDPVSFGVLKILANEKVQIGYLLKVGTGVPKGNAINKARAYATGSTTDIASNIATAQVAVIADTVLEDATLIGKVFHDRDGDGYQDESNATGITVKSDYFGWNGLHLGSLKGRVSVLDDSAKHRKIIRMPYGKKNDFKVVTKQGTLITVDNLGQVSESHIGSKAKGLTGQELEVTTRRINGIPTPIKLASKRLLTHPTDVLEITITNMGIHEEGIPGVRLATVKGIVIETDGYGRYHMPDVDGGGRTFANNGKNFILKVDAATLPDGAKFTTENPRVLRITGSALNKINFGVKLPVQAAPQGRFQQGAQYRTETRKHVKTREVPVYKSVEVTLGSIFFDKDKHNVRADQRGNMENIADKIKRYGRGHIIIDAFTDSRHNAQYNIALANRRAHTVRSELQKRLGSKLMRHVKIEVDQRAYTEVPHNDPDAIDYIKSP